MKEKRIIKRFSNFIKLIKPSDHLAILYDTDADGICSAAIISHALAKLKQSVERFIPCSHANFNQVRLKALRDEGINKIITVDFSGDQYGDEFVKEVDVFDAVLILDHHKVYADLNSQKITFIKAQFIREDLAGSEYCTAKLTFDLFSNLIDISEVDWLAAVGIISDMAQEPWKDFLQKVYKKYNINKRILIEISSVINAGKQTEPPQVERALNVVMNARKPKDILKSDFSKIAESLQNEIEFWVNKFEEKAEKRGKIWFYEINPSGRIGSVVSTLLALKYPDDTIIVARRQNNWVSINARNHNSKQAVNELLEKATKGLRGANSGGHIPAAGATIREKDFEEFKKRIWELA